MRRFNRKRQLAISLKMSERGKKSQAAQRARREAAITPEFLMELKANPTLGPGSVLGAIQWTNHITGKVTRWAVLRGDRRNNITPIRWAV
jgi:hypothetical protein